MKLEDYRRYNRHLILNEIGFEGQSKLLKAKVLIVGVGGLGSPIAMYLAASGIGTIGIVEFDTIDTSNLQRQIIYDSKSIGESKVLVAKEKIKLLNPDCNVETYNVRLSSSNVIEIFKNYDFIVDATDNLKTRYLINDACVLLKKIYVYGSIQNFEGQATVFDSTEGPCYRCVFPEAPKSKDIPGSLEQGVLGVLPGIIGLIQATEIIKLICNIGKSLKGRMIMYDALNMEFNEFLITKNNRCPICGKDKILKLNDYESLKNLEPDLNEIKLINGDIIFDKKVKCKDYLLIDVRDEKEFKLRNIPNSKNIPLNKLNDYVDYINNLDVKSVILMCQNQERSIIAYKILNNLIYKDLYVLKDGLNSWHFINSN